MDTPQFDQASYHGRLDDGSETGASFIGARNVGWTQLVDTTFRCRFAILETDGFASTNFREDIQYQLNGGGYTGVSSSGSGAAVIFVSSANYTHGDDTTQQILAGTFIGTNGGMTQSASSGQGTIPDFAGSDFFEAEFALAIESAQVNDGDIINLRLTEKGTALLLYTNVPIITVDKPAAGLSPAGFMHRMEHSLAPNPNLRM